MNSKKAKQLRRLSESTTIGEAITKYVGIPRTPSNRTVRNRMAHFASLGREELTKEDITTISSSTIQKVVDPKCTRGFYHKM